MLKFSSLRTRLILAYVGLIILGFSLLAAIAGRQLFDAAREDYERQTFNETALAARGIERAVQDYFEQEIGEEELEAELVTFESQINCNLTLFLFEFPERNDPPQQQQGGRPDFDDHTDRKHTLPDEWSDYAELQAASQDQYTLVERKNTEGERTLYAAAPIMSRFGMLGYIQSAEPASNFYRQIYQRWTALGLGVAAITAVSLAASIYLSLSLIRPLKTLQASALELAQGNLTHRAPRLGTDELNAVGNAFNTMADRLGAMIEEQRAFASNTSHELRTPLTTMRLRTEALRYDKAMDQETQAQYVEELDDELLRMSSLIDDLILLSRFDAGRAQLGTEQIDFIRFAENLSRTFSRDAEAKQVRLQLIPPQPGEDVLAIEASLNHVTILFRNLLENALKYTPSGGTITWRIQIEGDQLVSLIQDTGQGIDPENIPHLFERFFRGDKAHSREIPGTGLGLSLVKAIADVYRADIRLESAGQGQGTTAIVRWQRH